MSKRAAFLLFLLFIIGTLTWWQIERPQITTNLRPPLPALNAPPAVDPSCPDRLRAQPGVRFALADRFETTPGCVVEGAILVRTLAGINLRPNGALMRCEVAEALHNWLSEDVQPQAEDTLQSSITQVQHMGTYSCRRIAGSQNLSQHSFANAIDISGFRLENGQRLRLTQGWKSDSEAVRTFWKKIHRRSCRHFSVALGPDYNAAHTDHFHFDLGPMRACQ